MTHYCAALVSGEVSVVAEGVTAVGSWKNFERLPPLPDSPLAKAESISTSAITCLRGESLLGRFHCLGNLFFGEERVVRETTVQTSKSVRKEWGGMPEQPFSRLNPCSP